MSRSAIITEFFENMGAMRRMMLQKHGDAKDLPTRAQMGILMILQENSMSIKDIAEKFCMTSSGVTQLVDSLVKENLLTRKEDADDRRKIGVSLTDEGKKKLALARTAHLASISKLLEPLTDTELSQLLHLQKKIVDSVSRS